MPIKVSNKARNNFFDFVKMFCIMFVVITHISWTDQQRKFPFFPIVIDMAVPLFLVISAYLRASKIQKTGIKEFISPKSVSKNLVNILVAYIIAGFVEIGLALFYSYTRIETYYPFLDSPKEFVKWFLTGLTGPGSYYVPILIQMMIYIPILYFPFKKGKRWGLFVSFIINLGYELLVYYCKMDPSIYRLLIFRYTLILGFGIYLSFQKQEKKELSTFIFLSIGLAYIVINAYVFTFPLFQNWKSTSMFCAPFAYSLIYFGMFRFSQIKHRKYLILGQASYHIYLTQMVFYAFQGEAIVKGHIPSINSPISDFLSALIIVVICFSVGLGFYFIETRIREKIKLIIFRSV